jgi:hypothetical protein
MTSQGVCDELDIQLIEEKYAIHKVFCGVTILESDHLQDRKIIIKETSARN